MTTRGHRPGSGKAGPGVAPHSSAAPVRRGSDARSPAGLGPAQWRQVVQRAGRHLVVSRLPQLSAGVAFFAVLSIAPVLVTALSMYGAINTPAQAMAQLAEVTRLLPPELEDLVEDQLTTISAASTQVLTRRGLVGLGLALWTATTAMSYLLDALTVAYHEAETRGFWRRTALALGFVLGGAVLLGAVIAVTGVASRATSGAPELVREVLLRVLLWLVVAALMVTALAVLYRVAPDRRQARWRWISWGATGATSLWLVTSLGLLAYVQRLGAYEATYGSLAGVAISMFWVWITVFLVVAGAAVNGEAERQTVRDSTVGRERPPGERGAVVADSTPPYSDDE